MDVQIQSFISLNIKEGSCDLPVESNKVILHHENAIKQEYIKQECDQQEGKANEIPLENKTWSTYIYTWHTHI